MLSTLLKGGRRLAAAVCFTMMLTMSVSAAPAFFAELEERLDGSPLQVLSILGESMMNGVTSMEMETVDWLGNRNTFSMSLYAGNDGQEAAVFFDMQDRWTDLQFELFANQEVMAARVNEFTGDYLLGFSFATLEADLLTLLDDLYERGIMPAFPDAAELEYVMDYIRMLQEMINLEEQLDFSDFADLLVPVMLRSQMSVSEAEVGGETVTRVAVTVDVNVLFNFAHAVIDRITQIDETGMLELAFSAYRMMFDIMQDSMGSGYITAAMYTNEADRLVQAKLAFTSTQANMDLNEISVVANFGESATDVWTFDLTFDDVWDVFTGSMTWEVKNGNVNEQIFTIFPTGEDAPDETVTFGSRWNRATGALTLFAELGTRIQGRESITGNLTANRNSFNLRFADEDFSIEVSARVGVAVPSFEFVNISEWAGLDLPWNLLFGSGVAPLDAAYDGYTELYAPQELVELVPVVEPVVEPSAYRTAVVANCHFLYLRRGPGMSYSAFSHLVVGDVVTVLESRGGWHRVDTHRGIGWVFGRYLDMR